MIEQMIEQLNHADPTLRFEAAKQLGASGNERAVLPLIDLLADDNAKVQYAAFSGLVKLGDARAAEPMVNLLLTDPDNRLWELIKLGIGSRLRAGLLDLIQSGDDAMADRLTAALDNDMLDEQQQAFVLRLLGRTQDTRAVELLIDRLIQDTPTIQGAAAEALGYIGDARAVSPLLLFLQEDESTLREVATEALGRLGDSRAVPQVLERLEDDNEWVRRAACVSLGQLGDKRAMEALSRRLQDETVMVQDAAFEAIKQLSDTNYTMTL